MVDNLFSFVPRIGGLENNKTYMDPSEPLSKEIAVYIAQNEATIVVVELFKRVRFFFGHLV